MSLKRVTKRNIIILSFLAAAIAVGTYFGVSSRSHTSANPYYPKASEKATPLVSPSKSVAASMAGSTPSISTPSPLAKSSKPSLSKDGQVSITFPTAGDTVTSGSTVTGNARVFEGTINFRLKGSSSGVLASGSAQVHGDSASFSPFSINLSFSNNVCDSNKFCGPGAVDSGVLEVFSYSPKDGSEVSSASVSVNIKG